MPPPTRKVSGGRQSTLSFNHRVTKASVPKQSAKEAALLAKPAKKAEGEVQPKKAEEAAPEDKAAAAAAAEAATETAVQGQEADEEEETQPDAEPVAAPRPAAEAEADAVTDAQIGRYWKSIEAQSISRPVHQEGLDLGEKVLRHFDVSSQFGPCVGITRKKRWVRAQRLGLAPPIEVLAVMLQEEAKGVEGVQRSSFDDILNAPVTA